jgi:hypothetical protein
MGVRGGGTVLTTQKAFDDHGDHCTSAASQLVVLGKYLGVSYGLSKSTTKSPFRLTLVSAPSGGGGGGRGGGYEASTMSRAQGEMDLRQGST